MRYSPHCSSLQRFTRLVACGFVLSGGVGCSLFHSTPGTKERMDEPRPQLANEKDQKKRDMLVEVTTDANGEVVNIVFKRSSGADTIDSYVADSIHNKWPKIPSTVTLAEVTFSMAGGFSQPRMISSHPAP